MHELQPHKLQLVVNGFKVISTKISQEKNYVGKEMEADALGNVFMWQHTILWCALE